MSALPGPALAAALAGLAVDWPPPWRVVAWVDGRGGLHMQPVDKTRKQACDHAARVLLGGAARVWVLELDDTDEGGELELLMVLGRGDGGCGCTVSART